MSEPKFDLTGDESDRDVERRSRSSAIPPEDHLQTTRLPAISPPPASLFSSSPPSAVIAVAPRLPSFDPLPGDSTAPPSSVTEPPAGKPSWLRGLLTATFPPPSTDAFVADERVQRRRAGSVAAILSLVMVITSLVVGLRAAPPAEPSVAATTVACRAAVALGILAFAAALLRAAERLFFLPADSPDSRPRDPNRSASQPIN
jgi:hypothetical protein